MTTAKSSFSLRRVMPVYRNTLRRYRGSALFYGALGFLFLPLQYLLTLLENLNASDLDWALRAFIGPSKAYNGFSVFFFTALSLIMPLVLATSIFGYMHNRRSVDVYHSLPLRREELFFSHTAAGLTVIWLPMAINFALVMLMSPLVPGSSAGLILLELLCWMAVTLVIFSITAFASAQVGTTFDTSVFSMILNGSPAAVYLIVVALSTSFLYGYRSSEEMLYTVYRLSPFSLMIGRQVLRSGASVDAARMAQNYAAIAIWFAAGLVLFWAGAWLYARRKSEQAESLGNLGPLQIAVRTVSTLVGGYAIGMIFCLVFNIENKPISVAAIGVGALLSYFIVDVVLARSVRSLPRSLPAALVTTLAVCAAVSMVIFGGMGFETRVPDADSVVSVDLGYYRGRFESEPSEDLSSRNTVLTERKAIELITQVHGAQVDAHLRQDEPDEETMYGYGYRTLEIVYRLKSGKTMRRYYNPLYPDAFDGLVSLEGNDEFIRSRHAVYRVSAEDVQNVLVGNALGSSTKELKLSRTQKEQLLEALRQDLLEQPESEWREGTQAVASVTLQIPKRVFYQDSEIKGYLPEEDTSLLQSEVVVTVSFRHTLGLLKEFGAGSALSNNFSDVEAAWVGVAYGSINLTPVMQAGRGQIDSLGGEIFSLYRKFEGEEGSTFAKMSDSQFEGIIPYLTSFYSNTPAESCVVVGVRAAGVLAEDEQGITGYYFLPFSRLPQSLQDEVIARGRDYYGSWAVNSYTRAAALSPVS